MNASVCISFAGVSTILAARRTLYTASFKTCKLSEYCKRVQQDKSTVHNILWMH